MKPAPMPLDLVRARFQLFTGQRPADDRRVGRLDRHGSDGLAFGVLDVAADAGQRAAGADAGDEHVDFTVGVFPDFRAGGFSWMAGLAGLLNCCRIR